LYPINYRDRDYGQWYKKYQWIEVDIEKNKKDPRPESYRPKSEIRVKDFSEKKLSGTQNDDYRWGSYGTLP